MSKTPVYEMIYFMKGDPGKALTIKGAILGFVTDKQFADIMDAPKKWASKIGSAQQYDIEKLATVMSDKDLANKRLVMRYNDRDDGKRLFITGKILEGCIIIDMNSQASMILQDANLRDISIQ